MYVSTVVIFWLQTVQGIIALDPVIVAMQEKYAQLELSISQRLHWAAGANQSLQVILEKFELASQERSELLVVLSSLYSVKNSMQ